MFSTSDSYKVGIKSSSRSFETKITIGQKIYNNDDVEEIKLENTLSSDSFIIGATTSQKLEMTLINKGDIVLGASEIKLETGLLINGQYEYIPMGLFNIDDTNKNEHTTSITAYDNMIKFETPYFSSLGDNPTLTQVANELASITGVQFTGTLPNYTVTKLDGLTCREVLGYVASLCGGNAKITRDGRFTIIYPKDINVALDANNYFDYDREESKYKIGKITCKAGEEELIVGALGTDCMELVFENPWVTEPILNDIYARLKGFEYLGYSMKWQGDPSLDVGDILTVTDIKNVVRKVLILKQSFDYRGGLTSVISAKGESKNENSFNSNGSLGNKVERVVMEQALMNEALINKANIKDLEAQEARIHILEVDTGKIANLLAGNITAENIDVELLKVLQGWMLEGSIGDAQIKDLSANKINAGDIDTSLVTIVSKDGSVIITGNQIMINDVTDPKNPINRITIGKIKKADGSIDYSMIIRAEDGQTVMFDSKTGITNAGITSGAIKDNVVADDANIKGFKLDINSVIREVNEKGTVTISGTKIQVGDKLLNVVLSEQNNTIAEQGKTLSSHTTRIEANEKAISLKVDSSTYTTDMQNVSKTLSDQSARLTLAEEGIKLAVTKTEISNTIKEVAPYVVDIISTNGIIFKNGDISTTLIARVYKNNEDVTDTIDANRFRWTRVSNNAEEDDAWNTAHFGGTKQITVTSSDVKVRATFNCFIIN